MDALRGRPRSGIRIWAPLVVRWVLRVAFAVVLRADFGVAVAREAIRL